MYSANWTGRVVRMGLGCEGVGWITCVSGFSAESHEGVLVELAGLVVARFEDGCASHRCFGGGDDAEVFAGDAE